MAVELVDVAEICESVFAFLVVRRNAVVLVEAVAAFAVAVRREDHDVDGLGQVGHPIAHSAQRQRRPLLHEERHLHYPAGYERVTFVVALAGEVIGPAVARKVDDLGSQPVVSPARLRYGRREHVVAQQIFLGINIGITLRWIIVVQRPHERQTFLIEFVSAGIYIGKELGAQNVAALQRGLKLAPEPGAAVKVYVVSGMKPERGGGGAELQPTGVKLGVPSAVVTAHVVRPVAAAGVGGDRVHGDLESQHGPAAACVAGKLDGVLLVAQAAPAGKGKASLVRLVGVLVVELIQPGPMLQARDAGNVRIDVILLPVHPPDVHAFFFQRFVGVLEVGVHIFLVAGLERNDAAAFSAFAQGLHEVLIAPFVVPDAVGGVNVKGNMQSFLPHFLQELFGVRQKVPVPGPARPAVSPGVANAFGGFSVMPLHVPDQHVQGISLLFVFLD